MRALLPGLLVLAACGAPLEEEEDMPLPVEVRSDTLRSWTVRLGDARCSGACALPAPAADPRAPLVVEGVTPQGRSFTVDRELWLPAGRELVSMEVSEGEVLLNFIDVAAPPGIALQGMTLSNSTPRSVVAFGGCALHRLDAWSAAELDCLTDRAVALQLDEALAPDVTATTTYLLRPD